MTTPPSRLSTARSAGVGLSNAALIQVAVVAVLAVLAYLGPIRGLLISRWMTDGNWSHGPLIPVFCLYFLWLRREALLCVRAKPSYFGAVVLVGSLAVYFLSAWWFRMGYPQGVSMIGAIFGVTLLLGGWPVIRLTWFPILFLLLAVPLPQTLYVSLTLPLRSLAAWVAASAMPLFVNGLHTEAQAVVIDYVVPGSAPDTLNVEEACSGMRLTMAFVTLGIIMAYLGDRPLWQRVVMVLMCIPIAVFCNAVRVTITGLLVVTGQDAWARGTPHQLLGILMLVLALGLFALLRSVLGRLFVEEETEAPQTAGAV